MLDSRYPNNAGDNDSGTLRAELTLEGVVERREGSWVAGGHPEGIFEGEFIPGYEFISELGRGGMGIVYKARDRKLKRLVAIKMIRSGSNAGRAERLRFQAEAEAVAQLHHNNIVDIFEVGEHDNMPYIVFELIDGGSLKSYVAGKPKRATYGASLVEALASAVQLAHEREIIHRDLKPSNVLLDTNGEPRVTDFGLAKQKNNDVSDTRAGAVLGTPAYMSPEQASVNPDEITSATDIYSLGAILYYVLTGRPPFQSANDIDTIFHVVNSQPVSPRRLSPAVPVDLETICLKCLEKDPARRFHSAAELADDLRRFLDGKPVTAKRASECRKVMLWVRRSPYKAISLILLTVLLGTVIWFQEHLLTIAESERAKEVERNIQLQVLADNAIQEAKRADQQAALAVESDVAAARATTLALQSANRAIDAEYLSIMNLITTDIQNLNYEAANRRIVKFQSRIEEAGYDPTGAEWASLNSIANTFYHRISLGEGRSALRFAYSDNRRLIACLSKAENSALRLHLINPYTGEASWPEGLDLPEFVDESLDGPSIVWINETRILLGASSGLYSVSLTGDLDYTEVKVTRLTAGVILDVVKHPDAQSVFISLLASGESPNVVVWRWYPEDPITLKEEIFSTSISANISRLAIDATGSYLGLGIGNKFHLLSPEGQLLDEVQSYSPADGTIKSVCFIPNERPDDNGIAESISVAFAGHHKLLEVYEWQKERKNLELKHRLRPHLGMIQSLSFDSNSGCLLSSSNDRMISCVRPSNGERLFILQEHDAEVVQVASVKDGEFIVSSSLDGVLAVRKRLVAHHDLVGLNSKREANLTNPVLLKDGKHALVTHTSFRHGNGDVVLLELASHRVIQREVLPAAAAIGCANKDADVVVIPLLDGNVGVISFKDGAVELQLADTSSLPAEPIKALSAVFSSDTNRFYVSMLLANGQTVITCLTADYVSLELVYDYRLEDAQRPPLLGLSPNGGILVSLSREVGVGRQQLRVIRLGDNFRENRLVGAVEIPFDTPTRHLAVLESSTVDRKEGRAFRVFVALEEAIVQEFWIHAGMEEEFRVRKTGEYTGHYIDVRTLLLSADGRRLSSFGLDGCFCTWQIPAFVSEQSVYRVEPLMRWQVQLQRYGGIYLKRDTGELVLSYDKGVAVIPWEIGEVESERQ